MRVRCETASSSRANPRLEMTTPHSVLPRQRKCGFATSLKAAIAIGRMRDAPAGVLHESASRAYRFRVIASNSSGVWNEAVRFWIFRSHPPTTRPSGSVCRSWLC